MALKLDGKPFDPSRTAWSVATLSKFLQNSPPDEVFTLAHITKLTGASEHIFKGAINHPALLAMTAVVGRNRFWGNPKAIKELLKQVAA